VILGPGEGHAHYPARDSEMFFKASAGLDGGDLSLMERTLPPGGGQAPARRRHTNCSEAHFVLDGRVSIIVEGEELTVGREGFALVPPGTARPLRITSAEPPAAGDPHPAMDGYFAGLHELWNCPGPPSPDEERAHVPLWHGPRVGEPITIVSSGWGRPRRRRR